MSSASVSATARGAARSPLRESFAAASSIAATSGSVTHRYQVDPASNYHGACRVEWKPGSTNYRAVTGRRSWATTDVPYRSFVQIVDGSKLDNIAKDIARKFDMNDLVRSMALDKEVPGVLRETHVVPNWFRGGGLVFELSEIWQTPLLTGLVVNVRNETGAPTEVNLPSITIPKTGEWGILRKAAMENMRLAPKGRPSDTGTLFLVFSR